MHGGPSQNVQSNAPFKLTFSLKLLFVFNCPLIVVSVKGISIFYIFSPKRFHKIDLGNVFC